MLSQRAPLRIFAMVHTAYSFQTRFFRWQAKTRNHTYDTYRDMYHARNAERKVLSVLRPPKWPGKLLELKYRRNTSNAYCVITSCTSERAAESGRNLSASGHLVVISICKSGQKQQFLANSRVQCALRTQMAWQRDHVE